VPAFPIPKNVASSGSENRIQNGKGIQHYPVCEGLSLGKVMHLNIHLKIVGTLMLMLAAAHAYFPKPFGWKDDLRQLSLVNRQIFLVHCIFIVLVLVLSGLLSLFCAELLTQPSLLARAVLSGLVVFWAVRLFAQFFIYDAKLWKGNLFNTTMHVLFSLMWTYYVTVYVAVLWSQYHK
jgi:hypothetical protein